MQFVGCLLCNAIWSLGWEEYPWLSQYIFSRSKETWEFLRGRLGKLMLCSEDFKSCFILSSIFMKQTHSNCMLADHLSMGVWWSQPCVTGILSLTCLHLVEVLYPLLMSPAWFYFAVYGFSSSWHAFSSRVCIVKFRHAWFLRAAASWWAWGFCFVLHLVFTLLVLLSSVVGFFGAGKVLPLFVF